ncbi:uncharacterized protein LOC111083745, partial [Limulus polyphemus]|uniref:Uncharacterized protein LOC111083745 n=1 Tax=Limulus polyphemus TaxID=6850 RepID=A0ABM1RXL7_LIMPO
IVVKVYARVLSADVEYKTLSIGPYTTSKEVVRILLNKFRMKHRDPNLYYLAMEVWIRKTDCLCLVDIAVILRLFVFDRIGKQRNMDQLGTPRTIQKGPATNRVLATVSKLRCLVTGEKPRTKTSVAKSFYISQTTVQKIMKKDINHENEANRVWVHLENLEERPTRFFKSAPPVCRFVLQMRMGGLVKVYDGCLMTGSLYKSLLVSDRTTTEEFIQLLLRCYNSQERPNKFALFEISTTQKYERKLHQKDYPLLIQQAWSNQECFAFHLRRNSESFHKRKLLWMRCTNVSGQHSFRMSVRDEVSPTAIHSPTLKPSFNNYDNFFYI